MFLLLYIICVIIKLLLFLKRLGVNVSKKGRLSFDDFCAKIIKTMDHDKSIAFVNDDQKYYINGRLYITHDAALSILINFYNKAVVSFCVNHLNDLISEYNYDIVSSKQKIIKFKDAEFVYFNIYKNKWYKAKDICIFFNYSNCNDSIIKHVSNTNKIYFGDLRIVSRNDNIFILNKNFIDVQTIFVNQHGLKNELLLKSAKPNSIPLAKYFGITVNQKFTRKEIDIVHELDLFVNQQISNPNILIFIVTPNVSMLLTII